MQIYIYVKNGEKFTGKDNRQYDVLYAIKIVWQYATLRSQNQQSI